MSYHQLMEINEKNMQNPHLNNTYNFLPIEEKSSAKS